MQDDALWLRKALVAAFALIYWAGVFLQTRRVRRLIGRPPNVKPRGPKETALWAGWFFVIAGWAGQPFLTGLQPGWLWSLITGLTHAATALLGVVLVGIGYAGTLWCYTALGEHWRMGVNPREKTTLIRCGPYRWVRHPIYALQVVILAGVFLLLPTGFSAVLIGVHLLCVAIKALDEEAHLQKTCGIDYAAYAAATGRFLPKLRPPRPA